MACRLVVPWTEELLGYDFGPAHPLAPVRVDLTIALAQQFNVLTHGNLIAVDHHDDANLELVHTAAYVDAVREAGATLRPDPVHQLGGDDNPVFPRMHEAAALVVAGSLTAAAAVVEGRSDHAINVAGGLHHAMAGHASGFCIYNDAAIAIAWVLSAGGVERVAYVDVDVHHGDGVQAAFWNDPRVMTVSLHESGRYLFPGTGFPIETGGPDAQGTAVNVALPPGTGDLGWHRAFDAIVPPLLHAFRPTCLVTQHGCDTHALDPLADLLLTVDGQRLAHAKLHRLAHEVCDGRWIGLGGGGYELARVVPRSWTHLLAVGIGSPIPPETPTPAEWRELVKRRTGETAPLRMTDGGAVDGHMADITDQAVSATKLAVFASHGLHAE